jgi:adenosylcobinamide-GDP ribazoletransferase
MMPRSVRPFLVAVQFLTRLPVPRIDGFEPEDLARSAVYFPAVGVIIGMLLAATNWCVDAAGPWVSGLATLVVWIWITGALHLDGLGDLADGLGASHGTSDRFDKVVDDPHVGSFAVVAIAVQIVAKLVLLAHIANGSRVWALVLIPAWARWGTLVWSRSLPPMKAGLGRRVSQSVSWGGIAVWGALLGGVSALVARQALAALMAVPLIALYWRYRLGSVSGDCLGAGVEVTETLLLLAFAVRPA